MEPTEPTEPTKPVEPAHPIEANGALEPVGSTAVTPSKPKLTIRLDLLEPFAADPDQHLTFSDLQAAFGTDLHTTQKILRVLRAAQLLVAPAPGRLKKPSYVLEKELLKMLVGRRPQRISRAKALECAAQAIAAVAVHNSEANLARVTAIEFSGALINESAASVDCVDVQVTVAVIPDGALVQGITALLRRLRHVGNGALRESLVLEVG